MNSVEQSEALHTQVREFGESALGGRLSPEALRTRFDELALQIARFQAQHCEAVGRRMAGGISKLTSPHDLPAIPSDVFRLARVAAHPPQLDQAVFRSSGTTLAHTSEHCVRTLHTYRFLSTLFGRKALLAGARNVTVVALMPSVRELPHSSLAAMCQFFMEEFDGRTLPGENESVPYGERPSRWLVSKPGVNLEGLRAAAKVAEQRAEPLLLLAPSLALALLLEALGPERLPLPPNSVVMQTGGSKGRSREIDPEQLRLQAARALDLGPTQIIGEYGMTELGSQLYEGTLWQSPPQPGVYFAPPWLRVAAVDPVSLLPVAEGETGLARFIDLANVDSAVCIVTRDLIQRDGEGIRLLGRQPNSPLRGCSLLIEPLLASGL